MIPQYCTAHPVLRITSQKWRNLACLINSTGNMATFISAGNLARHKNGRFQKMSDSNRTKSLCLARKRLSESCKGPSAVCEFPVTGRRIVELSLLANQLDSGCSVCGTPLRLSNCTQETVSGLGSFLYITCSEEGCGEVNVCHTSKAHRAQARGRSVFDINTKLAAGKYKQFS